MFTKQSFRFSICCDLSCIKVRSSKHSRFSKIFWKKFWNRHKRKTKAKENKKVIWLKKSLFSAVGKSQWKQRWLRGLLAERTEETTDLSCLQCSRNQKYLSEWLSWAETVTIVLLLRTRDCADKFPLSRIPVSACVKKKKQEHPANRRTESVKRRVR